MPRISKQSINEVRLRANFVELVSDYTTLKRSGSSWKGLSPFAPEKTPSFYVHPDKEFCYCFSTGQGGDIFRFLMLKESLSFQDAVERVAHRFGIDLHYEDGPSETAEQRTLRAQLYELHEEAVSIFINAFRAKNAAAGALRDYWRDTRKFSDDVAAEFNIGFAPADGANLAAILNQRGFTKEALAASGLFTGIDYNPDPLRWHPRFHNRLIIPIRDAQGRTVAFTARLLPFAPQAETDPTRNAKYVNSPETPIFHKSQLLFNLDRAKDATKDGTPIVLVEGQLDAIRAYTTGAKTAVAGQGTAVGEAHMLLLKRYCKSVDLLLDADRAGQAAALKIIPLALAASLEPRILHVPGGKDPDEFLASAGTDGWKQIIEQPIDAASFIARALLPKGAEHSDIEKATALASFFEIASNAESTVTQGTLLDRVATQSALNPLDVRSDFKRYVKRQRDLKRLRENAKRKAAEANEIANGNEVTETAGAGEAAAAGDVADIDGTTAAGEVVAASGAAGATGAVAAAAAAAAAAESAAAAAAAALAETTATFTSVQTTRPIESSTIEETLLAIALANSELAKRFAPNIASDWLDKTAPAGRLLDRLIAEIIEGEWSGVSTDLDALAESEDEKNFVARIITGDDLNPSEQQLDSTAEKIADECLKKILARRIKLITTQIQTLSANASLPGADAASIADERLRLSLERKKLRERATLGFF